jgi:uncharacterized protein (TIGR02596 family)
MKRNAFSLIELLVVVAIIGILATLSVPAWNAIAEGNRMSSAAQSLSDGLRLARQLALAKNSPVEFRIFNTLPKDGGTSNYCAFAYYQLTDSGTTNQMTRTNFLPSGTALSTAANYSTLIGPSGPSYSASPAYNSFRFRPDGSTDLSVSSNWYVTIVRERDAANTTLPNNFITIKLDAFNGNVSFYRK